MKKAILFLSLGWMLFGLSACGFEIVDTGYRGVEIRLGAVIGEPLPEGLHFYNPFTSSIREYHVREETWSEKTSIFTKDTQRVDVSFSVTYNPDPKAVTHIYQTIGRKYELVEKIVKPVVLGSIKDAIGQVIADELVSKRELVTKQALAEVKENLAARNVFVTDLQFTDLDFDDAYEKAVEEKVVAIQNAQRAKNETARITEEAIQIEKTATAEANAMKIKSNALAQNRGLVEFELAQKWDGKLPQYMFGSSIPMIDVKSLTK